MTAPSKSHGILYCLSAVFVVWLYLFCIASGFLGSLFLLAFQLPIPLLVCLLFLADSEGSRRTGWVMLWVWSALTLAFIIMFQCRSSSDAQDGLAFLFYPIYIAIITPILTLLLYIIYCFIDIIKRIYCFIAKKYIGYQDENNQ